MIKVSASIALVALASTFAATALAAPPTALTTTRLISGLTQPTYVTSAPGDTTRLFIVEQAGRIKILKNGALNAVPFLDIATAKVLSGGERGLMSVAFHPAYQTNGFFFVYYTRKTDGAIMVERYTRTSADTADPLSGVTAFGPVLHPNSNHNGGQVQIGPDGMLYTAIGDGGSQNDPNCNGQKGTTYLGKVIRIDPDNFAVPPATNPFVSPTDGILDLIYSVGVRNPFRFSFDRDTGDFYLGDVGQDTIEEVDFMPFGTASGANFGWKIMEGTNCFGTGACLAGIPACGSAALTPPVHQYNHNAAGGTAVIGGYCYRGCAIPDLKGTYFFCDNSTNNIWSFKMVGGVKTAFTVRTAELDPPGTQNLTGIASFGEDWCGELLITDRAGGEIFKIIPAVTPPAGVDLGSGELASTGLPPTLAACGLLDSGNTADFSLKTAPANKTMIMFVGTSQSPIPLFGGTFVPALPAPLVLVLNTGPTGEFSFAVPGGGGPANLYVQALIDDVGGTDDVTLTNALKLQFLP